MQSLSSEGTIARRPDMLRALGAEDPPEQVEIGGTACHRTRILKHDSWAATAQYARPDGALIACKFSRTRPFLLLPFRRTGTILARREESVLEEMKNVDGFPRSAGPVAKNGEHLIHATAHYWIDGATFTPAAQVDDHFFPRLETMIRRFHVAGMAYVDMPKWENIIVGADGKPYLLDYQIRFRPLKGLPLGWALRMLQRADLFYLRRHWSRARPDQCRPPDAPLGVRLGETAGRGWRLFRQLLLRLFGVTQDPRKTQP